MKSRMQRYQCVLGRGQIKTQLYLIGEPILYWKMEAERGGGGEGAVGGGEEGTGD